MRREKLVAAGLTSSAIAMAPRIASACAVCGLGPNDVGGHAFNSSVLFMIAAPYITFAVIGGAIYFAWRKHRAQDSSIADSHNFQGSSSR